MDSNAVGTIVSGSATKAQLIESGLVNVKRFSAKSIAGRYVKLYSDLVKTS